MSSTIPHVVMHLTRGLTASDIPASSVTTAQIILNAALVAQGTSGILELSAHATPPAPLLAASLGSGIAWPRWYFALAKDADNIAVLYGPGFVKTRRGSGPLTDVWTEDAQGSVVRISGVRVAVRRLPGPRPANSIVLPTLRTLDSDDSDAESDFSSSPTVYSLSPIASPKLGSKPHALPIVRPLPSIPSPKRAVAHSPVAGPRAQAKTKTQYLYRGGVTRVMTGGVMLGAGPKSA